MTGVLYETQPIAPTVSQCAMKEPSHNELAQRPAACPSCHSKAVGTHAKEVTRATYWHCQACGETWNVTKRKSAPSAR
jgi:transposase-like protein